MNLERGDHVRVADWPAVACWFIGYKTEKKPVYSVDYLPKYVCDNYEEHEGGFSHAWTGDAVWEEDDAEASVCPGCGEEVEPYECELLEFFTEEYDTVTDESIGVVRMVGDDRDHEVDIDDIIPISREDFCGECGQIGCRHDGYDRSEDDE